MCVCACVCVCMCVCMPVCDCVYVRVCMFTVFELAQLIGLESGPASVSSGAELGFTAVETRLADANALRLVSGFVKAHTPELLSAGASRMTLACSDGLTRPCWKFALHRVSSALRDVTSSVRSQDM